MDVSKLALEPEPPLCQGAYSEPCLFGPTYQEALEHDGFSVLEVLSQCPTYFGRFNGMPDAVQMLEWFKSNTFMAKSPYEERKEKYPSVYSEMIKRRRS